METKKSNQKTISICKFKSYYVVWKPTDNQYIQCDRNRLNRTMQYGNKNKQKHNGKHKRSLNRTMQYGN